MAGAFQIPFALLELMRSTAVSLSVRAAAATALHAVRSDQDARTIRQLEKYGGACTYERVLLSLIDNCAAKCNLLVDERSQAMFEQSPEEILK